MRFLISRVHFPQEISFEKSHMKKSHFRNSEKLRNDGFFWEVAQIVGNDATNLDLKFWLEFSNRCGDMGGGVKWGVQSIKRLFFHHESSPEYRSHFTQINRRVFEMC